MATIEWHQGFKGCSTNNDAISFFAVKSGNIQASVSYSTTGGFNNGPSVKGFNPGAYPVGVVDIIPRKTVVVGFFIRDIGVYDTLSYYASYPYTTFIRVKASTSYLVVQNTTTGIKFAKNGVILAGNATPITKDIHHVEVKVFSDAINGTFQLKLDGALIIDESGLNTSGSDIEEVLFGTMNCNQYYSEMFIADDWIGELKHEICYPTSDHSVAFTPTSGTDNYAMVDDAGTHDGDTTTVSASASGTKDLYGYTDLPAGLNVKCATVVTPAKKDDVGTVVLNVLAKQDSTEYELDSKALATAYPSGTGTAPTKVVPTQPDGTPWGDSSTFNDIYWGFGVD